MKLLGRPQLVGIPGLGATGAPTRRATPATAGRIPGDAVPPGARHVDPHCTLTVLAAARLRHGVARPRHPPGPCGHPRGALLPNWHPHAPECPASTQERLTPAVASLLLRTMIPAGDAGRGVAVSSKFSCPGQARLQSLPTSPCRVILVTGHVWSCSRAMGGNAACSRSFSPGGGLVVNRAARAAVTWTSSRATRLWIGRSTGSSINLAIRCIALKRRPLLFAFLILRHPATKDSRSGTCSRRSSSGRRLRRAVQALRTHGCSVARRVPRRPPDRTALPGRVPVARSRGAGMPRNNQAMKTRVVLRAASLGRLVPSPP